MRRKENEITDTDEIVEIIRRSTVCRLAMSENERPYIVPTSFGFKDNKLFFHSSPAGKKIDILKKNYHVCVEFDIDDVVAKTDKACKWGFILFLKSFGGFKYTNEAFPNMPGGFSEVVTSIPFPVIASPEKNAMHFTRGLAISS